MAIIRQKDSNNKKEKEKTKKYNFQGKYERSIFWFNLDHEWLVENFRTRETDFYKNYQNNTKVNDTKTYQLFVVRIGNTKITENIVLHP